MGRARREEFSPIGALEESGEDPVLELRGFYRVVVRAGASHRAELAGDQRQQQRPLNCGAQKQLSSQRHH